MTRARVLMTTDVVGGVWDFALALASTIDADVTLLAVGEPSTVQVSAAQAARVELLCAPLKLEWMQDAESDVRETQTLIRKLVGERQPDIVHANQFCIATAGLDLPVVLTLHSEVLSWRRWTLGTTDVPRQWHGYADLVREALARADALVAVSHFLATQVHELYACSRSIDVVHNGWPAPEGAHHKEPITLVAGRAWDAAKNIALAAEAASGGQLGEVYLAGDQHHPETGQRWPIPDDIRQLGLLGRRAMDGWLARAAVYLSPARYDPFGLLPLQAALAGCALLLSDIPSYRELWNDAAVFFRSGDAADLRAQWSMLRADPALQARIAAVARARALERYTPQHMAEQYAAVYTRVRQAVPA